MRRNPSSSPMVERLVDKAMALSAGDVEGTVAWLKTIGARDIYISEDKKEAHVTGPSGIRVGLTATDPINSGALLGFVIAGQFWPQVFPGLTEEINRRWGTAGKGYSSPKRKNPPRAAYDKKMAVHYRSVHGGALCQTTAHFIWATAKIDKVTCQKCLKLIGSTRLLNPSHTPRWKRWKDQAEVDYGLKESWLEAVNKIPGFYVVLTCEGHPSYPQVNGELPWLEGESRRVISTALRIKRELLRQLPNTRVEISFWSGPDSSAGVIYDGAGRRRHSKFRELEELWDKYEHEITRVVVDLILQVKNEPSNAAVIDAWWRTMPGIVGEVMNKYCQNPKSRNPRLRNPEEIIQELQARVNALIEQRRQYGIRTEVAGEDGYTLYWANDGGGYWMTQFHPILKGTRITLDANEVFVPGANHEDLEILTWGKGAVKKYSGRYEHPRNREGRYLHPLPLWGGSFERRMAGTPDYSGIQIPPIIKQIRDEGLPREKEVDDALRRKAEES